MKKILALLMSLLMLVSCCSFAAAESEEWTCPDCGTVNTGKYCSECGAKRPEETGSWVCPNCGTENTGKFCSECGAKHGGDETVSSELSDGIRLDLEIAFEKNAYFSTYDVELYVDDELITVMRHGIDYAGTVEVAPGKHQISFKAASSAYRAAGSAVINISEPSLFACAIEAKNSTIQIMDERTEAISNDQPLPGTVEAVRIDGDLKLQVSIEFRKNGVFSQYDVDLYCDDVYVATLPHGKNYMNTLLVSPGSHMIMFYKSGDKSVRGSSSIKVDKDASFSCKIEATRNEVEVTKDRLAD